MTNYATPEENTVFDDKLVFVINDGSALLANNFSM